MEELEGMRRLEDHYRIRRELGRGRMGTVYLAEHQRFGTMMVIKLISFDDLQGGNRSRFLHEAQAVAAIRHPNVARIVEVGQIESGYYVVTEFIEGETLRKLIKTRSLELKEAIRIARQVAKALAAAHDVGVVHRDIRPENIFVNKSGDVTLTDFGIATVTGEVTGEVTAERDNLTGSGFVLGSVGYMSPEQMLGQNIGPRSDLWSLGVVLYEMASQHLPFEESSPEATLTSILKNNVPKRILAPELERIVTKALEKSEENRYQTAEDMVFDLEELEAKTLDSGTKSLESRRKREAPSLLDRLFRRLKKNVVQRGGELSTKEEESPSTLYINLWIEDESNTTVKLPALLKSEAPYTFLFAIERWSREEHGITESFVEPAEMKEQPKTPVVIELLCPFLVTKDESGYIRREVEYVAGSGFAPVSFPLKPNSLGSFFLTARLIVKGETIYREVLPLEVVSDEKFESLTADKFAVAAQEN